MGALLAGVVFVVAAVAVDQVMYTADYWTSGGSGACYCDLSIGSVIGPAGTW